MGEDVPSPTVNDLMCLERLVPSAPPPHLREKGGVGKGLCEGVLGGEVGLQSGC